MGENTSNQIFIEVRFASRDEERKKGVFFLILS